MSNSDSRRLSGKVAIITGAGQGIGKAIARLFASEGASVIVNARTKSKVTSVAESITSEGGTAHGVVADIGTADGVKQLISGTRERFEGIDILVHFIRACSLIDNIL